MLNSSDMVSDVKRRYVKTVVGVFVFLHERLSFFVGFGIFKPGIRFVGEDSVVFFDFF